MNIASIDLNLLVAFEALLDEGSVSRAAARVGLSQPAMSNALGRLRAIFGDALFVRTGRGMRPTPRAELLAEPVRNGLAQLRTAIGGLAPAFEPATSTATFRIAMTDYAELVLLAPLLSRVRRIAPGVHVLVRRLDQIFVAPEDEVRSGAFDAAIGFFSDAKALQPGSHVQDLLQEENVCIARKGHPAMRRRLTPQRFASAPQVGIFYRSDTRGLVDNILAAYGLERSLSATTPHFLAVPYLVAATDLIACVPEGLASRFRKVLPIEVHKMPVRLPVFHTRLLWHERTAEDPAHRWLRALIAEIP